MLRLKALPSLENFSFQNLLLLSQELEILFHYPRLDFQVLGFYLQFGEFHHEVMAEVVEKPDVFLGSVQVFEGQVDTPVRGVYFGIDLIVLSPECFQIFIRPVKDLYGVSQLLVNRENQEFDERGKGLHDLLEKGLRFFFGTSRTSNFGRGRIRRMGIIGALCMRRFRLLRLALNLDPDLLHDVRHIDVLIVYFYFICFLFLLFFHGFLLDPNVSLSLRVRRNKTRSF